MPLISSFLTSLYQLLNWHLPLDLPLIGHLSWQQLENLPRIHLGPGHLCVEYLTEVTYWQFRRLHPSASTSSLFITPVISSLIKLFLAGCVILRGGLSLSSRPFSLQVAIRLMSVPSRRFLPLLTSSVGLSHCLPFWAVTCSHPLSPFQQLGSHILSELRKSRTESALFTGVSLAPWVTAGNWREWTRLRERETYKQKCT